MGIEVVLMMLFGAMFVGALISGTDSSSHSEPGSEAEEIVINGTDAGDLLLGNSLDNTINAFAGDDTIIGGEGRNLVLAGAGNDSILINSDGDTVRGGGGDDLILSLASGSILDGGAGEDTLLGNLSDTLIGGPGNDLLLSGVGENLLQGGSGDDTLIGGTGDTLFGGEGDDVLISVGRGFDEFLRSANMMHGGPGNDLLISNGQDTLTGGGGNDVFRFTDWIGETPVNTYGTATITDFTPAQDIIELVIPDGREAPVLRTLAAPDGGSVTLFADDVAIVTLNGTATLNLARVVFISEADSIPPLPEVPAA